MQAGADTHDDGRGRRRGRLPRLGTVWYLAREASVWRTVRWYLRARSGPTVIVYPNVHLGLRRRASFSGGGRLFLGERFPFSGFMPSEFRALDGAALEVTGHFHIHTGFSISVHPGARLVLGSGFINNRVTIDCFDEIQIGNGVAISDRVVIRDSDNHQIAGGKPISRRVEIGDHVWIGMNVMVLKGVTIGDGAVVAAGAVVTRDVPPRALVAGIPARVVRNGVSWQ